MDPLSEDFRASLNPVMVEELADFLAEMGDKAETDEWIIRTALEGLERSYEKHKQAFEKWQRESGRRQAFEKWQRESGRRQAFEAQHEERQRVGNEMEADVRRPEMMRIKKAKVVKQKPVVQYLEREHKSIVSSLLERKGDHHDQMKDEEPERIKAECEHWARRTQRLADCVITVALTVAGIKQKRLKVSGGSVQEADDTNNKP